MSQHMIRSEDKADPSLSTWNAVPFLQKVTDIAPNIIYVFNQMSQSNEYSNRSLGASLGYSAAEIQQMGAALLPQICHPEDWPTVCAQLERIKHLEDGEVLIVEYRVKHKLGFWVWLMSHDTVFERDAQGQVIRHIGVASDISPQKAAERYALAEHLKAATTNDELAAFSYAMSHDMKAPSNTLNLLLTELLSSHKSTLQPDAIELINMALATVGRMGMLVDDVLDYTRVINQDFRSETLCLQTIVQDIVDDHQAMIKTEKAVIDMAELPVVKGDSMQIRILLSNLIENALKFHRPGVAPTVRILATELEDNAGYDITISDNGIGISAHKHEDIFTIFKRLNADSEFSGTGLGLAICRRIAANHGGKITLVSTPGVGSAFAIRLPQA